jgi:hypothetical protein
MQEAGGKVGVGYLLCILAEAQLADGQLADARGSALAAGRMIEAHRNGLYEAEVRRIDARLACAGTATRAQARRGFEAALAIARAQGARALELRSAVDFARFVAEEGDVRAALSIVAPVRAAFGECPPNEDLRRADELIRSLVRARGGARR